MKMLNDVFSMADNSIPVDIMTAILRGRGFADSEIRGAYSDIISSGNYVVEIDRQVPRFVRIQ